MGNLEKNPHFFLNQEKKSKISWVVFPGLQDPQGHIKKMETLSIPFDGETESIWLAEYTPIYTIGRSGYRSHFPAINNDSAASLYPIPRMHVQRGGQMTYHGPGQRIVYVLINLKTQGISCGEFIQLIKSWLLNTFTSLGLSTSYSEKEPGIWLQEYKICSIGLRIHQSMTFHGFAVNIHNELWPFQAIQPCGLDGEKISSLHRLGFNHITFHCFDTALKKCCPFIFSL
jgi:lipoyl(octanoyl) transferase